MASIEQKGQQAQYQAQATKPTTVNHNESSGSKSQTTSSESQKIQTQNQTSSAQTQTQTQQAQKAKQNLTLYKRQYSNRFFSAFRQIYQDHGLRTFWRGNMVNIIRYIPQQGCNMSFKDAIRRQLGVYHCQDQQYQSDYNQQYSNNSGSYANYGSQQNNFTSTTELFFKQCLAAGLGAGLSLSICYPLDYVRTRLATSTSAQFTGFWDCFNKTIQSSPSGYLGLYRGFVVSVTDVIIYRAIQLGTFDTIHSTILADFEYQVQTERESSDRRIIGTVESETSKVLRTKSNSQISISLHEVTDSSDDIDNIVQVSTNFNTNSKSFFNNNIHLLSSFAASLVGTILAIPFAYPFDTVKRRLMLESDLPVAQRTYKNTFHCVERVMIEEGLKGFYKGVLPSVMRSSGSALVPVIYERIKRFLNRKVEGRE